MGSKYSNRTVTVGVKNVQKILAKQSLNQGPPGLAPYALTTHPLTPFLLTIFYFCLINGFLKSIVNIVKIS